MPISFRPGRGTSVTRANFASRRAIAGSLVNSEPPLRRRKHADQHRRSSRPSQGDARGRCRSIRARARGAGGVAGTSGGRGSSKIPAEWISAVAKDLAAHRGASLVIAGEEQPPRVHALAHAMNAALGNVGQDRLLHRSARSESRKRNGIAARISERHQRRESGIAFYARRQ